ncbi:MAG TPA: STAS domain-containing protein [Methylibium sp.]|uniref:STAS domain-containing protein n=1 Tax=Methylibium sp. TaxID=2067992 RepID=UPI002DBC99CE|nr:STAS domain-containing protein [Methylibium sp.]HEU4458933.1 STAS domain-containing protein [Methylibium sp.]
MLLLPESLTLREARDAMRLLKTTLESEADALLIVDGSQLQRFDSSALAVLLECRRLAEAWGKSFELRAVPDKLAELARLYGIDELLAPASQSA